MGARRGSVIVMISGGGLGLTRPPVSHREGLSTDAGAAAGHGPIWPRPADAPPSAPCESAPGSWRRSTSRSTAAACTAGRNRVRHTVVGCPP